MTSHPTTRPDRSCRRRLLAVAALIALALGAGSAAIADPGAARADFDGDYYEFCLTGIGQSVTYCCQNSGGSLSNGECVDAVADVSGPTIQRRRSPVIIGPVINP
jgi:hypothetical protein